MVHPLDHAQDDEILLDTGCSLSVLPVAYVVKT